MGEIDWNTELRKIEREYNGLPPEPSPAQQKMKRELEKAAVERKAQRRGQLGVYVRLVPVLALSAALLVWPYPSRCGTQLFAFLGAIGATAIAGLWLVVLTWRWRMPVTHALAMAIVAWGALIAGREVLPRVGYAKADPARAPGFRCVATAVVTK
jgi:hypothetical protein